MDFQTIKKISKKLKYLRNHANRSGNPERNGGQRVILTYHGLSESPKFNCVAQSLFRDQISWLKERYTVIPLSDLVEPVLSSKQKTSIDYASITFDDAYDNFSELALPILQEYKCHATVFVPSGKVGLYNDWDEGINGFHRMTIMSYDTLCQLPKEHVEIGSHGISHRPLNRLTPNEVERELVESRLHIEQNTGRPVNFFAFPHGVYPFSRKIKLVNEGNRLMGGYKAACTTWWGRYNSLKEISMLRRIGLWDCDIFEDFTDKLNGYYDWLEKKEALGRLVKRVKSYLLF